MSVFLDIFFVAAPLSSLYVLTSFLSGYARYAVFAASVLAYLLIVYFCRDKVGKLISTVLAKFEPLSQKEMFVIIAVFALVAKVIFTIFFNYDGTQSGDIKIYNDIADQIISTGNIHSDAISHLYGLALHFVVFKLIKLPIHVGLFIVFFAGIAINFFSFSKLIGKEKAFFIVLLYLLMPSTVLMSFCPTHEIFIFMYVSLFLAAYNRLIGEENRTKALCWALVCVISTVLACFVNPGGYIIYIIMILTVLLSSITIDKKIMIVACLVLSVLCSNLISKALNVNEYSTTINTYTILIHGTNPESLGEQVDGYPLKQMRYYIYDHTLDFSEDGFVDAAKHVLINQIKYLLTHPVNLIRLIVHKIYILWSGVHYPIELAKFYGAVDGLFYYVFLGISTLIYLFVFTIGNAYRKDGRELDSIYISNYKLELLGVIGLTLMCIVANKYSTYATMFAYLTAVHRAELKQK